LDSKLKIRVPAPLAQRERKKIQYWQRIVGMDRIFGHPGGLGKPMKVDQIKANGVHYTPLELAEFLADAVVKRLPATKGPIEVLDPACGDGALLMAFAKALPRELRKRTVLSGYDTNGEALRQASDMLADVGVADVVLEPRDFLTVEGVDVDSRCEQLSFFDEFDSVALRLFDAVIANPPYVRTQVLGADAAQKLAKRFALSGRVDLYHAFTKAMTNVLKPDGILGLLTSNRFLTVKSGASIRRLLRTEFHLEAIYDLGDTKLFAAAVLPVIVVGRKQRSSPVSCVFDRVYEYRPDGKAATPAHTSASILDAFRDRTVKGIVRASTGTFRIERGSLEGTADDDVWTLSTSDSQEWLNCTGMHRAYSFDEVANIRVGIKTTADDVFIRDDWDSLPAKLLPESDLLRPLLTHIETERWTPTVPSCRVLYTHTVKNGKRVPIRLKDYPRARAYLESHEERLSRRKYVIDAGRQWYEIWVPHNPSDWCRPKVVSPDICEEPRFCFDPTGAVVNGDCYWITLRPGLKSEWLLLLLAVANSSFVTRYYDIAFHNKLYAGRRRFMTQYVKKFPMPRLETPLAQKIIQLVRDQIANETQDRDRETVIDRLVWESFGLAEEARR
jgi:methylase of polypeptide subunit release factors